MQANTPIISMLLALLQLTATLAQNVSILSSTGLFYSPNYPLDYDNNEFMTYNLTVPEGNYIYITLMSFITEPNFDVLSIYDGNEQWPKYQLSGDCTGQTYALASNTALFKFTSDLTGTAKGFAIKFDSIEWNSSYTAPDACPDSFYNTDRGFITSPNWPSDYPNSINCNWTIKSISNRVKLDFSAFNTEASYDVVSIYDGAGPNGTLIARLSGDPKNLTPIISTGRNLYINFQSDIENTFSGFSAYYESID